MGARSINQVVKAERVKMGDVWLYQSIPLRGIEMVDPFLLIHHWFDTLKGGANPAEVGVGPHPHRGFAPVTFVFKGAVHHRDSLGHSEIVRAGGTQWMHSGSGLVHSERPDAKSAVEGGEFEIIQFWVNVPASDKMSKPFYKPLHAGETPSVKLDEGRVNVAVVSGELNGVKGAIGTSTPQTLLRLDGRAGQKFQLPLSQKSNALLYVLNGSVNVGEHTSRDRELVWFQNDGDHIELQFLEDTRAIVLSGEPINEKVVSYGPFVMNTEREIREAITDFQMGKMGTLEEKFD